MGFLSDEVKSFSVVKRSVVKLRMKEKLPKDCRLNSDAVDCMVGLLQQTFDSVMASVDKEPYKIIAGYVVEKHCNRHRIDVQRVKELETLIENVRQQISDKQTRAEVL